MACLRVGATQPVLGATSGLQDRVLSGIGPGVTAGWEQEGKHPWPFILSVHWSTCRKRLRPGCQAGLGVDAHFLCSSISLHKTILHLPLPVPHIAFVPPQDGTEELGESSQCTLPTIPLEGLHTPHGLHLMQGVTPGGDPPLPSVCPKPGADLPSWPSQLCQKLCPRFLFSEVHQV